MKKTFKLSVPYLGKAVVVTVVSFSCAISAYQLYQNSSIFSPQSQALDLKNNQVVFSNQNQQTNTNQNQDESQYLNENQQALDKISQTNFNNSPYLFKNQGRVDPTKIYGQTGMGTNGGNTIGVNPNGTTNNGNATVVIPGTGMPIATGDASSGIANDEVNKNTIMKQHRLLIQIQNQRYQIYRIMRFIKMPFLCQIQELNKKKMQNTIFILWLQKIYILTILQCSMMVV